MSTPDYKTLLKTNGYVVLPTPIDPTKCPNRFEKVVSAFDNHFLTSPEFKSGDVSDPNFKPVLGGGAWTGNPSSFNHRNIRRLREMWEAYILDQDVLPLNGRKLEQPFDRCVLRREGQTPTGEDIHRDVARTALKGDTVWGGWVNLDTTDQHFLCAPKTHIEKAKGEGFAVIKDQEEIKRLERLIVKVRIPPGHMLIFDEKLAHKVAPTKAKALVRRMHLGWRATHSDEPLFGKSQTLEWCEDQAVPKIKSGQNPRVYPSCYGNFPEHFDFLSEWSKRTFAPECLIQHTVKQGKCKGMTFSRVRHTMRSLREYGLPMHPPYDPHEKALLMPQQELYLRSFDNPHARQHYRLPTAEEWRAHKRAKVAMPEGAEARCPRPEVVLSDEEE